MARRLASRRRHLDREVQAANRAHEVHNLDVRFSVAAGEVRMDLERHPALRFNGTIPGGNSSQAVEH
jgi:hypothetical protein